MPNGPAHAVFTVGVGTAAAATALYCHIPAQETVALAVGFLATLLINPDLDLPRRHFPYQRPSEWVFWVYIFPYNHVTYHRSLLSHGPIVGTAFRILYFFVPIWLIFHLLGVDFHGIYPLAVWAAAGMAVSDIVHSLLDVTVTSIRRAL
jgi:uncharacterized metal-binding protein